MICIYEIGKFYITEEISVAFYTNLDESFLDFLEAQNCNDFLGESFGLDYIPLKNYKDIYVIVSLYKGIILIGPQHELILAEPDIRTRLMKIPDLVKIEDNQLQPLYPVSVINSEKKDYNEIFELVKKLNNLDIFETTEAGRLYTLFCSIVQGLQSSKIKVDLNYEGSDQNVVIEKVHNQIKHFDPIQEESVFSDGGINERVIKFQGIAGSGKTLILAYKMLDFHFKNPDKYLVYTFHNRKLQGHIRSIMIEIANNVGAPQIDWNKFLIQHAWGSQDAPGFYRILCTVFKIAPLPLKKGQNGRREYNDVCEDLVIQFQKNNLSKISDIGLVVVDEAQDFINAPAFYEMCSLVTNKDTKFIFAGDVFQTIFSSNDHHMFKYADQYIEHSKESTTIGLLNSYRTPKDILLFAHTVGLGLYLPSPIYLPPSAEAWKTIGYKVTPDTYSAGDQIKLSREHIKGFFDISLQDSLVINFEFNSIEQECSYIINNIKENLANGIPHEEICIIMLDYNKNDYPLYYNILKQYFNIYDAQNNKEVRKNSQFNDQQFRDLTAKVEKLITLTSMNHIKGQEFDVVYIININQNDFGHTPISTLLKPASEKIKNTRNRFFVAMTRAKAFITITGNKDNLLLKNEFDRIKDDINNNKYTTFVQPSDIEIGRLRVSMDIQSDKEREIQKKIQRTVKKINFRLEKLDTKELREKELVKTKKELEQFQQELKVLKALKTIHKEKSL